MKAQEYLDKNWADKSIAQLNLTEEIVGEKLTEDLIIKDYSNLGEINLKEHELTSLSIINCPSLKKINVRNNKLTKLEINSNNVEEIIVNGNELTELDLTNCQQIKRLMIADNSNLATLKGLNFKSIKHLNLINTSTSLDESYAELGQELSELRQANNSLKEILIKINEAGIKQKLSLVEPIQTSKQADEAIKRQLEKTEENWRGYFDCKDPKVIEDKYYLLDLRLGDLEARQRAKKILMWIIEAQVSGNYEELVRRWNDGDKYNPKYDYDDESLDNLMHLLNMRKQIREKEELKKQQATINQV